MSWDQITGGKKRNLLNATLESLLEVPKFAPVSSTSTTESVVSRIMDVGLDKSKNLFPNESRCDHILIIRIPRFRAKEGVQTIPQLYLAPKEGI
jgi:hypothetical protein